MRFSLGLLAVIACAPAQAPLVVPSPPPARPVASAPAPVEPSGSGRAPLVSADVSTPAVATTRAVPQACDGPGECLPPSAFTEAVCKHKFPDLPLYLFAGKMPWRHLYVKAEDVEPVNPHGGDQNEMWMHFGEEVVLLGKPGPGAARQLAVSGPSDVDVLRWDGTCATIREEMLVPYVTAAMQSPRIIWKYLDQGSQDALLKNSAVARARESEKKSCRDSSVTHPTGPCEKAMQKLTNAIVLAVHQNVELPGTGALPEWIEAPH